MLNHLAATIKKAQRNRVIHHPNSVHARILRKKINRVGNSVFGMPTLGGLGVLSADDEENIEYESLGNAFALKIRFEPSGMMERLDANNGSDTSIYQIEPEFLEGEPGGFSIQVHDVMFYGLNDIVTLAYEIMAIDANIDMSPYIAQYVCSRRSELNFK